MKAISCLIIDDEVLARQRLKRLLKTYEMFEITGEAANGREGLEQIERLQPDLIFLDIEMPVLNGFEMLSLLKKQPKVVFTTAYDQYAIKAFEENSVDYLLKPIEKERLEKTVIKIKNNAGSGNSALPIQQLIEQLKPKQQLKTLTVKIGDKILLIRLEDIYHIEAEEKYVFLRTLGGVSHLTDFTLASLEERLPENFVRIHRSSIINADRIREIRKSFNGSLVFVMDDQANSRISSSRGYSDELRERFEI
ncbi:response regulator [Flavihumibacter sp. R14]|nr:response regulator [Flavihumibacter soli]